MSATLPQQAGDSRWYVVVSEEAPERPQGCDGRCPLFPVLSVCVFDKEQQRWRAVNGTHGVARIIAGEDGPLPISGGVVAALRARLNAKGFVELWTRPDFAPSELVSIKSESFVDTLGLFEGFRDQDRVAVLLDLLGSKVRVVPGEELVEKAA